VGFVDAHPALSLPLFRLGNQEHASGVPSSGWNVAVSS